MTVKIPRSACFKCQKRKDRAGLIVRASGSHLQNNEAHNERFSTRVSVDLPIVYKVLIGWSLITTVFSITP